MFSYRFFQMLRCNRGQTDHQRWMVKYEIARQEAVDAWFDATTPKPIAGEAAVIAQVDRLREAARDRQRAEAGRDWAGAPGDLAAAVAAVAMPEATDAVREAAIETVWRVNRRARVDQFPISDNLSALMALVMADLSESQRLSTFCASFFPSFFPLPTVPFLPESPPPSSDLKTPPFPRGNAIFRGWGAARVLEGVTPQKKEGISLKNGAQKLVRRETLMNLIYQRDIELTDLTLHQLRDFLITLFHAPQSSLENTSWSHKSGPRSKAGHSARVASPTRQVERKGFDGTPVLPAIPQGRRKRQEDWQE